MAQHVLQVLKEDGRLANKKATVNLKPDQLEHLYRTMVLVRALEERAMLAQRQGKIGFYIGCLGQEASHIGSGYALEQQDWIFPAYRQPGIPLLRGIPVQALVDNLFGNARDTSKGRQMPCHYSFRKANFVSISSPIGTHLIQAAGAAMAARIRGDKAVVLAYLGDGGTSSNDFHNAMNFAGVYKSPCVFFCENNGWAISVPVSRQTASESMAIKAVAYGFEGVRVDGNDILAVYQATRQAVDKARNGGGPTLIEAVTFRLGSHSSSDDATRYCPKEDIEAWKEKDPIPRFRRYLEGESLWDEEREKALWEQVKADVAAAFKDAEAVGPPSLASMFQDVYKDVPPHLQAQMDALLDEQRRLGASDNTSQAFPL